MKLPDLKKLSVFALIAFVTILTACSPNNPSPIPESRQAAKPFYEETPPGVLENYTSFYIKPVRVYTIEGDYLRSVSSADTKQLSENFRRKLIQRLGANQSTIPVAAKGVAIIEVTIADVSSTYATFQLLPGFIAPNVMRGGASIEAKVSDSISGEQLAIFRETRQGGRQGYFSGLGKWDGVEKAFDEWAGMLDVKIHG